MASRKEQKEQARQRRLAEQQARAERERRQRRLQAGLGGLLAPASDGEYTPATTPASGYTVHALEHGRIEYQSSRSVPAADVKDLEALFNEGDAQWAPRQMLLLFQNQTQMPYAVAATAWGHVLGCKRFTPRVFDALRDFRIADTNLGPEQLGTGPE